MLFQPVQWPAALWPAAAAQQSRLFWARLEYPRRHRLASTKGRTDFTPVEMFITITIIMKQLCQRPQCTYRQQQHHTPATRSILSSHPSIMDRHLQSRLKLLFHRRRKTVCIHSTLCLCSVQHFCFKMMIKFVFVVVYFQKNTRTIQMKW